MSQRDVQNRIGSVKNIQKITRAMEMMSAARLRRAEQRISHLRPYAKAIRRMTRQAAEAAGVQRIAYTSLLRADTSGSPLAADHVLPAGPGVDDTEFVDHLASATVRFRPHTGLAPGSTLDLTVTDGALAATALRVVVVEQGGAARTVPAARTAGGWRVTVPGFDTASTSAVEVTMVNGATTRSADDSTLDYVATVTP